MQSKTTQVKDLQRRSGGRTAAGKTGGWVIEFVTDQALLKVTVANRVELRVVLFDLL